MPTITLFSSRHLLTAHEFPADANLKQSLFTLASSSNVAPPHTFRVYNQDKDLLNLTDQRCVGRQPLEVEVETTLQARMLSLEADLAQLMAESAQRDAEMAQRDAEMAQLKAQSKAHSAAIADLWAPRIRNVAAQLLLLVCEQETLRTTTTDYFRRRLGTQHEGVRGLAADMAVSPARLVDQADGVMTRRNAEVHFGNLAQLEQEVQEVQRNITPLLEACCRWECKFVKAYDNIKQHFPARFV